MVNCVTGGVKLLIMCYSAFSFVYSTVSIFKLGIIWDVGSGKNVSNFSKWPRSRYRKCIETCQELTQSRSDYFLLILVTPTYPKWQHSANNLQPNTFKVIGVYHI